MTRIQRAGGGGACGWCRGGEVRGFFSRLLSPPVESKVVVV